MTSYHRSTYVDLLFYRKRGLLFAPWVRFQTRSQWSHVAIRFMNGDVIEALPFKGVIKRKAIAADNDAAVLRIDVPEFDYVAMYNWACRQVGHGYDYLGVLRFITRIPHRTNHRWFCSGVGFQMFMERQISLLARTEEWEVSPGLLWRTPLGRVLTKGST